MKAFPLTVLDNFFDKPDQLRELALNLSYSRSPDNKWPGCRSADLVEIDVNLYRLLCSKIISVFADVVATPDVRWSAEANFQLIPKGEHSAGWVHSDLGRSLTAILYLSPNGNMENGTSLYRLNDLTYDQQYNQYKDFSKPAEELEPYRVKNNELFTETARVGGFYNRLIMFDSAEFHSANSFHVDDDDRLTLIFFFSDIQGYGDTPVARVNRLLV